MEYEISHKNKVLRSKKRAHYDTETVHAILDAGKICHVGITLDKQPFVIPMAYARDSNQIFLHGALNSRLCKSLVEGIQACVTVTLVDGLVLARSTFHHSINYRSVVAFGTAKLIDNIEQKQHALESIVEFLTPGRTSDCRAANAKELNATSVIAFDIEQASAKVRNGDPNDLESDLDRDVWAGVVPINSICGDWVESQDLKAGVSFPDYKERLNQSV